MELVDVRSFTVDMLGGECIDGMTVTATDLCDLVAIGMTSHTTLVGCPGPGRMVMAGRAILAELGMHFMIKFNTFEIFCHDIYRHLARHVVEGQGHAGCHDECEDRHQGD